MALSKSTLSGLINTNLSGFLTIKDSAQLDDFCNAIADAVVDHIQAAATVPAGIPVSTSGGAGSTSGPGTVQ